MCIVHILGATKPQNPFGCYAAHSSLICPTPSLRQNKTFSKTKLELRGLSVCSSYNKQFIGFQEIFNLCTNILGPMFAQSWLRIGSAGMGTLLPLLCCLWGWLSWAKGQWQTVLTPVNRSKSGIFVSLLRTQNCFGWYGKSCAHHLMHYGLRHDESNLTLVCLSVGVLPNQSSKTKLKESKGTWYVNNQVT